MPLSLQTLVPLFLDKAPSQVEAIYQDAEKVVLGFATSISALNQTAAFDRGDAAIVLEAVRKVRRIRKDNPGATSESLPEPALAHQLRMGSQVLWGP